MATFKEPKTIAEMRVVLNKWMDLLEARKDPEEDEDVVDCLNGVLDMYWEDDSFGTEGQLDPRGDHRD